MALDMKAVTTGAGACVLAAGAAWGMIEVHAKGTHVNSVTRDELLLLRELMGAEHATIMSEVRAVRDLIDRGRQND